MTADSPAERETELSLRLRAFTGAATLEEVVFTEPRSGLRACRLCHLVASARSHTDDCPVPAIEAAARAAGRAETEQALRDLVHLVHSFELAWGTVGRPTSEITSDAMALFAGLDPARAALPADGGEDA